MATMVASVGECLNAKLAYFRNNMMLRRLLRPKEVCKFVCVASAVVGLLCSARSSSLNMFRKWIWSFWWKILICIVLIFFICSFLLFITARQHSIAPWLKAHLTFLALIACIIYSIVFETVVDVKPDAYSAISCASFAIMCLCLSRLTKFGFEIEFLYFFCGDLIVQLWKIEHWLVIIGGCFIYFLVVIPLLTPEEGLPVQDRSQVAVQSRSNSGVVNADRDSTLNTPPPENGDDDNTSLLDRAFLSDDRIVSLSNSSSHEENGDDDCLLIWPQLRNCIKALEKENQRLVPIVSSHIKTMVVDSELKGVDTTLVKDELPPEIVWRLRETVMQMVKAGFEEVCYNAYSKWRGKFLEQCMLALGLQPKAKEVAVNWMTTWQAAGYILFSNEKELCESVFDTLAWVVPLPKVCEELMFHLLSFAYSIIKTAGSFPIPKMSQSLFDMDMMWSSNGGRDTQLTGAVGMVNGALAALEKIGDYIYCNTDQATVAGGGEHQIIEQLTRNIKQICTSSGDLRSMEDDVKLIRIVRSFPISLPITEELTSYIEEFCKCSADLRDMEGYVRLIRRLGSFQISLPITEIIERNLEAKSIDYKDPVLGYGFMMNNLTYIRELTSIKGIPELGDDWFKQSTAKVKQNCGLYQSSLWNKMLDFLKPERDESIMELDRKRLIWFNTFFHEICEVQPTWIICGEQLPEQIRKSIVDIMVLAYGNFIGRFLEAYGKDVEPYIVYGILDIERWLSRFFVLDNAI